MASKKKINKKNIGEASVRKTSSYSDKNKAKRKKVAIITIAVLIAMLITTVMGSLMSFL